ncbi:hypothetical protein NA56DRAFT_712983 [Hyaloscypha hepaticicola]|uniref:Uncharacterized protein n=1 Tax=Hyaloscypha hepaticicola TaxID=2082293 RepID=A0A2J6PEX3_9HELO|nr:hypothetical protein NA56DRAFT_712983 [Hyaloscypha hepaticicola]
MSRLFNCFSHPTVSTSRSSDTLHPPPPYTETPSQSQSFHSAPSLSTQHRNNGYENLTLHFTQSENAVRERRLRGFHQRVVERGERGGERGGRVGKGGEAGNVAAQDMKGTKARGEREEKGMGAGVGRNFKEELGDDISELRLDGDAEGDNGKCEQEAREVTVTRIQPLVEVAAGVQGEGARQGESLQRGRGKGRNYCTPEVRRRVEEWIAGCEREGCKGFVKSVRTSEGSGENSSRGQSSGDGDGNEKRDEGAFFWSPKVQLSMYVK